MKINKTKKSRLIIISIAGAAILAAAGAYAAYTFTQQNGNDTEESTSKTQPAPEPSDEIETPKSEDTNTSTNTDRPTPPALDEKTNIQTVQMSSSVDIADGIVYIRGGIDNSVEYDGVCFASLSGPNSQTLRKETTLLQNASTTDCKTIKIPVTELNSGDWTYTLNYNSTNATGVSPSHAFEIH